MDAKDWYIWKEEELKHICQNCKHWYDLWKSNNCGSCDKLTDGNGTVYDKCRVYSDSEPITTEKNFGCIHWGKKN